ncbi:helix-turn-helix domain-containing protein [Streptomyces sp. NPDC086023]|uniref:helix-turn-helix domain-containing protein n=1 Tax=Streptomyces sp. NPDC086023 TaxID=3365746 RepID=UPI0037D26C60
MNESIGYAKCSLDEQDLTAEHSILLGLGAADECIYLGHGLTGTNRDRPGSLRTREGMAVARANGNLTGKQPKLTARQQSHLAQQHQSGEHTLADLAEPFSVSRATVYRVLERHQNAATPSTPGGQ